MRTLSSQTPTPETVDSHKKYGNLKFKAGLSAGVAVLFFGAAYATEGLDLLHIFLGVTSAGLAGSKNQQANQLSDDIEQRMLTSYTQKHFKSGAKSEDPRHNLSAEGRPLRDVTPKEEPAPA